MWVWDVGRHRQKCYCCRILEHVQGVKSLDVHVLMAQLVGAVQAQSKQIKDPSEQNEAQIKEQSKQIQDQSERITQLETQLV